MYILPTTLQPQTGKMRAHTHTHTHTHNTALHNNYLLTTPLIFPHPPPYN